MGLHAVAGALGAAILLGLVACGGGKGADSPGNCPEGTVLKGSDCLPADAPASKASAADDDAPKGDTSSTTSSSSSSGPGPSSDSSAAPPSSGKPAYDKDSVEIELKRAARQVKSNCGSATNDSGSAPGPWGKTSAAVTLGRNGHVREVSVPAPYDGAPDGVCAVNAFKKIQFPPYASSSDVVVQWDIEFVKPKK